MAKLHLLSALVVFGASTAYGKALSMPKPTAEVTLVSTGTSPRPTLPPMDLRRRQQGAQTVLVAPDNTCGFISGRAGAAYTCGVGANCVFATGTPGRVACCDGETCNLRLACLDLVDIAVSSLCDDGCAVDAFTLKCTNAAAPFCNTISFPGGVVDFWCNDLAISTPQLALTTFDGQPSRTFTPQVLTDESSEIRTQPTRSAGTSQSNGGGLSITTTGASRPTNTQSSNNDSGSSSGPPIGAIVGGVVGGVAVIALVAVGIFFVMRNKKKKASLLKQSTAYAPVTQQPPASGFNGAAPVAANGNGYPPYSPNGTSPTSGQTPYGYDPKFAVAVGQQHPTPPPEQQLYNAPPQQQPQPYATTMSPTSLYQPPPPSATPDRNQTTSPAMSHLTDNRLSAVSEMPSPSAPTFQPTIHEAGGEAVGTQGHHRGNMAELA